MGTGTLPGPNPPPKIAMHFRDVADGLSIPRLTASTAAAAAPPARGPLTQTLNPRCAPCLSCSARMSRLGGRNLSRSGCRVWAGRVVESFPSFFPTIWIRCCCFLEDKRRSLKHISPKIEYSHFKPTGPGAWRHSLLGFFCIFHCQFLF